LTVSAPCTQKHLKTRVQKGSHKPTTHNTSKPSNLPLALFICSWARAA